METIKMKEHSLRSQPSQKSLKKKNTHCGFDLHFPGGK